MRVKISSEKKERKSFMAKKKEKENIPLETRSSKIAKMKKSSCFHIDENLTQQFAQTGLPRSSISPFNPSRIESTSLCSSAVSSRFTVVESLRMSITSYLEQRSKVPIVLHKIMTEKVL